ncbi:lipoprotein signal peptidase [Microtetraspora sp. NBRC 13810]|uniref:signal peptidase II n=1 Tax=Microtetraspora sp. NBRC 13810 TaxID=3030990 RepID=UPI0024A34BE2|nr:signal peptidase II [Microtetraspora sp. NBRC 13810]GLW12192.1 lipoprotein signal peptidase [Microtetraspora sp. NBRC 13810]
MRGLQAAGGAPLSGEETGKGRPPEAAAPDPTGLPEDPQDPESAPPPEGAPATARRRLGVLSVIAVVIYVLDLVTKVLVVEFIEGREPVQVIGEYLQFRVIRNSGAAFSIGTGMTIVFTIIATVVVIAILRTARNLRSLPWAVTLGLLLGGAFGNLTDRIFRSPAPFQGHVVDFIQVFPATHFPIFNISDSSIVCGGILAVYLAWRGYQIDGTRQGAEK